jgi:predicted alpha/beta hydrolase
LRWYMQKCSHRACAVTGRTSDASSRLCRKWAAWSFWQDLYFPAAKFAHFPQTMAHWFLTWITLDEIHS